MALFHQDRQGRPRSSRFPQTGLFFTRCQERTQPGWLTQTGQTGYLVSCAIMLGLGARELTRGKLRVVWKHTGHKAVRELLCAFPMFILYVLPISIIVVTVCFLCCWLNCSYPHPPVFCLFLSIFLRTAGGRVDRETVWSFIDSHGQTATVYLVPKVCRG